MNSETNIETKLKEFHDYLRAGIERRVPEVGEDYDEGVHDAFIDIEKRFYDKILHELTHEHN
jgi:hypothetical protein